MRRAIYEDDVIKLLDKGWKSGVYPVASNIHALPSAQPEPCEDIRLMCGECDAWNQYKRKEPCEDAVSRQAVIELYKEYQPYMAVKVVEFGKAVEQLPSAQPDYTAIKYEIQRNIDDFYNSKHHAQHVSNNGRMIAFGLELALDIVKDVERREDDK